MCPPRRGYLQQDDAEAEGVRLARVGAVQRLGRPVAGAARPSARSHGGGAATGPG